MRDPGWYIFRLICWMFAFGLLPWVAVGVMVYYKASYMSVLVNGPTASTGTLLITGAVTTQLATLLLGFIYSLRLKSMALTVLMRSIVFVLAFAGFVAVMSVIVFAPKFLKPSQTLDTPNIQIHLH